MNENLCLARKKQTNKQTSTQNLASSQRHLGISCVFYSSCQVSFRRRLRSLLLCWCDIFRLCDVLYICDVT